VEALQENLQFKEGIGDLKHENVWVVVLMAYQNALASSPHPMVLIMFL